MKSSTSKSPAIEPASLSDSENEKNKQSGPLAANLNSIIKLMFHGNQLRGVSFQNKVKLTGEKNKKAIVCCGFPYKARIGFKTCRLRN